MQYCFKLKMKQNFEDTWPTFEEECSCTSLGKKCDPVCVYCQMKNARMPYALQPRKQASTRFVYSEFQAAGVSWVLDHPYSSFTAKLVIHS